MVWAPGELMSTVWLEGCLWCREGTGLTEVRLDLLKA